MVRRESDHRDTSHFRLYEEAETAQVEARRHTESDAMSTIGIIAHFVVSTR